MHLTVIREWVRNPLKLLIFLAAIVPLVFLIGFVQRYGSRVPMVDDTLGLVVPVAVLTEMGELSAGDLFTQWNGHRNVFTKLTSMIITYTTGWDLRVEYAVSIGLALANITLLVFLFVRTERSITHWIMLPLSTLFLSPHLGVVWVSPIYTVWHYNLFFTLMTTVLLVYRPPSWGTLIWVNVLALCATLSMAGGAANWILIAGYVGIHWNARRWRAVIFTLLFASISMFLYMGEGASIRFSAAATTDLNTVSLISFDKIMTYVLAILGGPIAFENTRVAIASAGVAAGLLLVNIFFLTMRHQLTHILQWLYILIYAGIVSALIAVARYSWGLDVAVQERYNMVGLLAWAALLAISLYTIWTIEQTPQGRWYETILTPLNITALVVIGSMYVFTVYTTTGTLQGEISLKDHLKLLNCYETYPLRELENCEPDWRHTEYDVLAALSLTTYKETPKQMILDNYQPQTPVIIVTDDAWYSVHVRNMLLDDVVAQDVVHVVPNINEPSIHHYFLKLPEPVVNLASWDELNPSWLEWASDDVWLLERTVWETSINPFDRKEILQNSHALLDAYETEHDLKVQHWTPIPQSLNTNVVFGSNDLRLIHTDVPQTRFKPCDALHINTFWSSSSPVTDALTITTTIVNTEGIGVARLDTAPLVPMTDWVANRTYADNRQIEIPCDIAPGSYNLLIGVYESETIQLLQATTGEGTPIGEMMFLTTIQVESNTG